MRANCNLRARLQRSARVRRGLLRCHLACGHAHWHAACSKGTHLQARVPRLREVISPIHARLGRSSPRVRGLAWAAG